jgi:hypothetical protein
VCHCDLSFLPAPRLFTIRRQRNHEDGPFFSRERFNKVKFRVQQVHRCNEEWPGFSTLFLEALPVERISRCFRFLEPINHGGCPRFGLGTWVLGLPCLIQSTTSMRTSPAGGAALDSEKDFGWPILSRRLRKGGAALRWLPL